MNGSDTNMSTPLDIERLPSESDPDESVSTAAIYARTSSNKPGHQYSIKEQVIRCWKRCNLHGWDVAFVFRDAGKSGKNIERSGFQDMLSKAEKGSFDVVVFWKLDRFCRSLADLIKTEEKLSEHDVALQSVTEYIDTASAVGRFNFRNLASAAELESDLTSNRVQMGMLGMARDHRWPNDHPPLGYELTEEQKLSILPHEAEVVRTIFNLYLELRSMPEVAYELNERGITTKKGNEWMRDGVRDILKNELYKGNYRLGEYEEYVEEYQLLSEHLFEKVTEVRYRFKHQKNEMSEERKKCKADDILNSFKTEIKK